MNVLKKAARGLAAAAMAPLVGLEKRERERRLDERFRRIQEKQVNN